jgi:toxin ParE1/3/4
VPANAIEFHDEAAAEYDAAFDWYLDRSPEAAHNFDAEVERGLTQIVQAPQRWSPGAFNSRRYLLRHFPFILIYRELKPGNLQIVAIAHTSRRPGYWSQRL